MKTIDIQRSQAKRKSSKKIKCRRRSLGSPGPVQPGHEQDSRLRAQTRRLCQRQASLLHSRFSILDSRFLRWLFKDCFSWRDDLR